MAPGNLLRLALLAGALLPAACGPGAGAPPTSTPGQPAPPGPATPPIAAAPATPLPGPAAPPGAGGGKETVKLGVVGATAEAGIYVALEKGYFEAAGVAVELTRFDSVTKAIPALASNEVDVGAGALGAALFSAAQRGVGIKIIGPQAQASGDNTPLWLVVRTDLADRVHDYAGLKGLRIAVPSKAGTNEYLLDVALRRGGLSPSDADVVELPFPDMVTALANGRIDAAELVEPLATTAAERGVAVKWRPLSDWAPEVQVAYLIAGPGLHAERPDIAQRWMTAYLRGARWYASALRQPGREQDELFEILATHTALKDVALLRRTSFPLLPPDGEIDHANIRAQAQWAVERGYVPSAPSLEQLVDERFIRGALQQLGPHQ